MHSLRLTPLYWAVLGGHEEVVKVLLAREDVDPNNTAMDARTPLWVAADNGHEGVVKLLLERGDINIEASDAYGRSPLWVAACQGREEIVKRLLARDVDSDGAKCDSAILLSVVAHNGHEGVVRLLLERHSRRVTNTADSHPG